MSVTVRLTPQELGLAATVGMYRTIGAMQHGRPQPLGASPYGRWTTDIEGCCAEMAFAKYANRYWSGALLKTPACGDVGAVEVRQSPYGGAHLLLHEEDPDEAVFVLVTGQAPVFQLRGWIRGTEGKEKRWWRALDGKRPCYAVPQDALHSMACLHEERAMEEVLR